MYIHSLNHKMFYFSSGEDEALAWPPFPSVSHTQQREEGAAVWNLKDPEVSLEISHWEWPKNFPSVIK